MDFAEAVIDWESSSYTKADKPMNAYDTLMSLTFTNKEECLGIIKQWGINRSYENISEDADWKSYVSMLPLVTETMILGEIMDWVRRNPERAIECLNYAISLKKTLRHQMKDYRYSRKKGGGSIMKCPGCGREMDYKTEHSGR